MKLIDQLYAQKIVQQVSRAEQTYHGGIKMYKKVPHTERTYHGGIS